MESPNFFAIIPADVRYSDIIPHAKLLYGEITALSNKTGSCYASNAYFASLYGVSVRQVSKWISELEKRGFIASKIEQWEGNKRYISLVTTYRTKVPDLWNKSSIPYGTKVLDPIEQKFLHNNTMNNTVNNIIIINEEEKEWNEMILEEEKEIDNIDDLRKFLNKWKLMDDFYWKIGDEESFERSTSDFFIFCYENGRKMNKKTVEAKFRAYLKPKWETDEDRKIMQNNFRRKKEKKSYVLVDQEEEKKEEFSQVNLEEIESKMSTQERIELQERAKNEVREILGNKILHHKALDILNRWRYKKLLLQREKETFE